MNINRLKDTSYEALLEISKYIAKNGRNSALRSIEEQMKFISTAAKNGENPKDRLDNGHQFTFGILSSREFSSPTELKIKEKIDKVTEQLIKI